MESLTNLLPDLEPSLQIVGLLFLLSFLPVMVVTMTPFLRIVLVLSLLRQALGTQNAPPTLVLVALSLILTGYILGPEITQINTKALVPLANNEIKLPKALDITYKELSGHMLRNVDVKDLKFFYTLSREPFPANVDDVSARELGTAYLLGELRRAFQIGFLVFIPFLVIDLIVANILLALGMIMLSPTIVSLPFKIMIFVAIDGWDLIVKGLAQSFN
ncbi:MAG: flagellar type III secretion system pore protein FliP [Candidatus Melainabacteria bacterium]|jgi:flagellar biosynthesis protein FliP|nr:flagellar type III secretion system pore protein FliP [Candidatus Melainabacteria bacterium]